MSDGTDFDPIGASIALMQAQIAKLQGAIETLEGVRSLLGGPVSSIGTARNGAETSFGHDAFFGMTASEAAKKYLAATKKTATAKAIAEAMVAGGWKSSSKNIPENVRTILARNPAFVVINGEFGLAEWYPGRKVAAKSKTAAHTFGEFAEQEMARQTERDLEEPVGEEPVIAPE